MRSWTCAPTCRRIVRPWRPNSRRSARLGAGSAESSGRNGALGALPRRAIALASDRAARREANCATCASRDQTMRDRRASAADGAAMVAGAAARLGTAGLALRARVALLAFSAVRVAPTLGRRRALANHATVVLGERRLEAMLAGTRASARRIRARHAAARAAHGTRAAVEVARAGAPAARSSLAHSSGAVPVARLTRGARLTPDGQPFASPLVALTPQSTRSTAQGPASQAP
jgi:hypothetical protein